MIENNFWKVCEALDCELRIKLLRYLISVETTEFPCVGELAKRFEVSNAAMSIHLKKLALAGLVSSKRADSYVYYRAFATSAESDCVIASLREFFATNPDIDRQTQFIAYVHILSQQASAYSAKRSNKRHKRFSKEIRNAAENCHSLILRTQHRRHHRFLRKHTKLRCRARKHTVKVNPRITSLLLI